MRRDAGALAKEIQALEQRLSVDDKGIEDLAGKLTKEEHEIVKAPTAAGDADILDQIRALEAKLADDKEEEEEACVGCKKSEDEDEEEFEASDKEEEKVEAEDEDEAEKVASELFKLAKAIVSEDEEDEEKEEVEAKKAEDKEEEKVEAKKAEDKEEEKVEAEDEEEQKEASTVEPGVEDKITQKFDKMEEKFNSPVKGETGLEALKHQKVASINRLKEATDRLDKVAEYLEQNGYKKLAYRIDMLSDALDTHKNNLSK